MLRWVVGALSTLLFCDATPKAMPANAPGTPILVELFTSEGCSSCPPADAVVQRLATAQPVAGASVIVLAHHVDYWDSLGWPDPWSSAAASARERSYGKGSYTPHAFIDGQVDMVGSRGAQIESAIADAAKRPHVPVSIDAVSVAGGVYDVTVHADGDVSIAVVQNRGKVVVERGENSGKTLEHVGIVRKMISGKTARITLPAAVAAPDGTTFSIAAFVQDPSTHKILGSAQTACR